MIILSIDILIHIIKLQYYMYNDSTTTPPVRRTQRNVSFQRTNSGAGEQFLLQDCREKADTEGTFFSQTPVSS